MNQNLCSENNIFRAKFNYSPVCTSIITVEQNSKIPMTNLKTYSKLMLQLFLTFNIFVIRKSLILVLMDLLT